MHNAPEPLPYSLRLVSCKQSSVPFTISPSRSCKNAPRESRESAISGPGTMIRM
uniref:Uncharacterized protein n=1 Tax=uncultured marine virus TaxID=186617 RepID=A0A0F7L312_9VIRU|nr:hypothetical protein [uncultured marine virus]